MAAKLATPMMKMGEGVRGTGSAASCRACLGEAARVAEHAGLRVIGISGPTRDTHVRGQTLESFRTRYYDSDANDLILQCGVGSDTISVQHPGSTAMSNAR
jgi:hypothetical protein